MSGLCVCVCVWPHIFTAQIDLIHALGRWYQESNKELLCGHVNIRSNLTSCAAELLNEHPVLGSNINILYIQMMDGSKKG